MVLSIRSFGLLVNRSETGLKIYAKHSRLLDRRKGLLSFNGTFGIFDKFFTLLDGLQKIVPSASDKNNYLKNNNDESLLIDVALDRSDIDVASV